MSCNACWEELPPSSGLTQKTGVHDFCCKRCSLGSSKYPKMNIFNILALSDLQGYFLVKIKAIWYMHNYRRIAKEQLRKVQILSRNIALNSGSISPKFISISNLSILLQILILNKAYYLQIKVGLIMIHHIRYDQFYRHLLSTRRKQIWNSDISGTRSTFGNPKLNDVRRAEIDQSNKPRWGLMARNRGRGSRN
jgi:hypothetical protein